LVAAADDTNGLAEAEPLALVVPLLRQRREISLLRKRVPPEEPGRPPVAEL